MPTHLQSLQVRPRYVGRSGNASRARGPACACSQPMGALGMSLLTKALRISTPGPNSVKLASTPKEVKKVLAVAGPALAVIPGYGTALAAGAAVITRADQMDKAKRLQSSAQNAGDANALLSAYSEISGQIPGRLIGLDTLKQLINAVGSTGGWPNVKKWNKQSAEDVFNGCKGCTPPTIPDWVKQQIASGNTDPRSMVSAWDAHVNSTWGSKWLVGSAGALQNQLLTDIFDFEVSQFAPNAPQTYGVPAPDQVASPPPSGGTLPAPSPTPSPTPTPTPTPGASPTPTPTPVTTPQGTTIIQVPAPTSGTDPNLQAYVKALMDQGATQQQAFQTALQALGNAGQQITPQTQAQVAGAVQSAASSPLPASMLYVGGGIAALVVLGIVMNRKKGRR